MVSTQYTTWLVHNMVSTQHG